MSAVAIAAAVALASSLAGAPAPAAKAAPGCVSKAEYSRIKMGQTPARVAAIVGTSGKVTQSINVDGSRLVTRDYRTCAPFRAGVVAVTFTADPGVELAASGKSAYWWTA